MSIKLKQHTHDHVILALVDQFNQLRDLSVGSNIHASVTAGGPPTGSPPVVLALTTSLPVASNLATSAALGNDLLRVANEHFKDTYAHSSAVSAALALTLAVDTTLAAGPQLVAVEALANALKAAVNTHYTAAGVNFNNDVTNTIAAATATDQATSNTLLNELRTKLPLHIAAALAGQHIELTVA